MMFAGVNSLRNALFKYKQRFALFSPQAQRYHTAMKNIIWFGFFAGLAVWSALVGGLYLLLTFGSALLQWLASGIPLFGADTVAWLIGVAHDMAGIICFFVWLAGALVMYVVKRVGIHVMHDVRGVGDNSPVRFDGNNVINGQAREIRE